MLEVYRDTTTEEEWITFYQYSSYGQLILTASPSAVSGYDDSYPDLLHSVDGNYECQQRSESVTKPRFGPGQGAGR
jgi:hypothetical protein